MDNQKERIKKFVHLVLVPCPLQGHMSPMLHLAKLLHSKGFLITIICTQLDPASPSCYPNLSFKTLFDIDAIASELSYNSFDGDVVLYLCVLNNKCTTPFRDCLSKLQQNSSYGPVSCIVYDAVMYFAAAIADEVDIPRIVLRTSSATTFLALSLDLKQTDLITKEIHFSEQPISEFPLLRGKDLPIFNSSDDEAKEEVLLKIHHGTETASAVIWNSLQCLEQAILKKAQDKILSPIYPICPTLHYNNQNGFSLIIKSSYTEDESCISWLDTQTPNSVIYVSIGSIVKITQSEFLEMAWGLANSDQPFLWVVRPGLVISGSNGLELLPNGFTEIIRKKGKVVEWAPQQRVLAHRSVGGFWTHNGWNSTIESVHAGVPMICWPRIGDQRVNARIVNHVWKVGIQLEENLERWKVESAIRRLMVRKEGGEMRKRAVELKEKVTVSLGQGGSSCEFLGKLVDFIRLL
ncbi:UDP-glycosyltransferase 76B1 [Morus notabilis]|uniref:UDP-glycosyltransferase 76B1 n=1 Tax=Morus notabilis TaxID=981085 RepID=UPI000CED4128|nr:UDP-glycosyltransferase 76B1 [Morus notabilis]